MILFKILSLLCGLTASVSLVDAASYVVEETPPQDAAPPVLSPFVSFSIEFVYFPDYAGNKTEPNSFSNQLLENLGEIQGVRPHIRIGGNTQDYALFNSSLKTSINGTYIPSKSTDYPYIIYIGPSYFESYLMWPNTKFSHGFNLAKNSSHNTQLLLDSVPFACQALSHDNLLVWELGNEPDDYKNAIQGALRPFNWTEKDYVHEWFNRTAALKKQMNIHCPHLADAKYMAPSFGGIDGSLKALTTWQDGLNDAGNIAFDAEHNYMGGADEPGVTLQKTLMNHTAVIQNAAQHVDFMKSLKSNNLASDIPYILGETNSLYSEGRAGLSNSFGAALWGVDWNLYCASQGIRRIYMHQGTDYRYAAWQPISTNKTTIGTKAPYYGNAMVAAMTKGGDDVTIVNIPLEQDTESAYAAYVDGKVTRIAVISMVEFNYTSIESDTSSNSRPKAQYSFKLPDSFKSHQISVQRMMANGSDAVTGVTWDGFSYNYELENGSPVRMKNVTNHETVQVDRDGMLVIDVPYSSAALVNLQ
ncbi:beta-glucuronidase [Penicillium angulare]|uniref:Beta-glucuronidase n=1 Tax=Penicillium angulare TaxID=116970 RepID=A0A9W9KJ70_9EURO|nr:beta-glucuronidase [Penicillium angulare]